MSSCTTRLSALALPVLAFALAVGTGANAQSAAESTIKPHAGGVTKPQIRFDPIPYGKGRKRQMANYSHRHYGERTWRLSRPEVIVLHYTATTTYGPVFATFAANDPAIGEHPGVCSQFVIEKNGTIHQLTRLYVRCRHTVGLNHKAIGIEMVQESLPSKHGSDKAILARKKQIRAATKLTAWLKQRYGIRMRDVIGHSMANDSRYFKDLEGWRNDHLDWLGSDVRKFRELVGSLIHRHR